MAARASDRARRAVVFDAGDGTTTAAKKNRVVRAMLDHDARRSRRAPPGAVPDCFSKNRAVGLGANRHASALLAIERQR